MTKKVKWHELKTCEIVPLCQIICTTNKGNNFRLDILPYFHYFEFPSSWVNSKAIVNLNHFLTSLRLLGHKERSINSSLNPRRSWRWDSKVSLASNYPRYIQVYVGWVSKKGRSTVRKLIMWLHSLSSQLYGLDQPSVIWKII